MSELIKTEEGETIPYPFDNPLYIQSKKWRVSTLNLSHTVFEKWGYGEESLTHIDFITREP